MPQGRHSDIQVTVPKLKPWRKTYSVLSTQDFYPSEIDQRLGPGLLIYRFKWGPFPKISPSRNKYSIHFRWI